MKIGIDVGGTNTDAVLIEKYNVLATIKSPTTTNVADGIITSLHGLNDIYSYSGSEIDSVMIGTTHFVNALVEANRLAPTAAIRLGLPATQNLPPFTDWPSHMVSSMNGRRYLCHGGHEFDGQVISPLNRDEVCRAINDATENGIMNFAISSVYSPVNSEFELEVADLIESEAPGALYSLSHEIGRIGLLERENATIINASLRPLSASICRSLKASLKNLNIYAPLYISQNDGTLMEVHHTERYPVATFSSGPTNSMRGAAFLSQLTDCIIVDVGGTTTDVGALQSGFPRETSSAVEVAGIRTNFRMPDVSSIGLGGGSRIRSKTEVTIGPDSVGQEIGNKAMVFGGCTLTATDIAVASGQASIGDSKLVSHLDNTILSSALEKISFMISDTVDRMRTSTELLPVVAVGGGSILIPPNISSASEVIWPQNASVANAVGAAIAQVGGEVDRVYSVAPGKRDEVLNTAREEAIENAISAGADRQTVAIVEVDELPLGYLPGNATRIRVKAVGDLPIS